MKAGEHVAVTEIGVFVCGSAKGGGNKEREGREIDREGKKERKAREEDRMKGRRRRRRRRGRKRENWPERNFFRLSKRYTCL